MGSAAFDSLYALLLMGTNDELLLSILCDIGEPIAPKLPPLLRHPRPNVQQVAAKTLVFLANRGKATLPIPDDLITIMELLPTDTEVASLLKAFAKAAPPEAATSQALIACLCHALTYESAGRDYHDAVGQALSIQGQQVFSPLCELLLDTAKQVQYPRIPIDIVSRCGHPGVPSALCNLILDSSSEETAVHAVEKLAERLRARDFELPESQFNLIAGRALELLEKWRLTHYLAKLLELLGEFGGSAEKEFVARVASGRFWYEQALTDAQIQALIGAHRQLFCGGVDAYFAMTDPRALPVLLKHCQSNRDDHRWALWHLAAHRSSSVGPFFESLMGERRTVDLDRDCIGAMGLAMLGERKGLQYLIDGITGKLGWKTENGWRAPYRSYPQLVYLLENGCDSFTDTDLDLLAHLGDHGESGEVFNQTPFREETETRTRGFSYARLRALATQERTKPRP